jgi:hypothetical protein
VADNQPVEAHQAEQEIMVQEAVTPQQTAPEQDRMNIRMQVPRLAKPPLAGSAPPCLHRLPHQQPATSRTVDAAMSHLGPAPATTATSAEELIR